MDPNATLENIRSLIEEYDQDAPVDVSELIEYVRALDEWLSKGGFLPAPWHR